MLVDALPVAVVRLQPRRVALGAAAVLLGLGRAGDRAAVAHAVDRPAAGLALERLLQREVGVEQVDVLERRRLVEDLVGAAIGHDGLAGARAAYSGAIRRFVSANEVIFLNAGPATVPP